MARYSDPILESMFGDRAGGNLYAAQDRDPEAIARANRIGKALGIPAETVDPDLAGMEAEKQQREFKRANVAHPTIGLWASDPRNAALGKDDIPGLVRVSKAFLSRLTPSTFSSLPREAPATDEEIARATATPGAIITDSKRMRAIEFGVAYREMMQSIRTSREGEVTAADLEALPGQAIRAAGGGVFDLSAGLYGIGRALGETVDTISPIAWAERKLFGQSLYGAMGRFFATRQAEGQAMGDAVAGAPARNRIARDVVSGFRSLPTSAGALALAAAGHPELGAQLTAASVAGSEYGRARERGIDPLRSVNYALSQGAVEFATERVPALRYFEDTNAGAGFVRKLVNNLGAELPQEQVATVVQDLNEWAILNPDKPFSSYLDDRPNAALSTAIATAVGSTVTVGTTEAIGSLVSNAAKVAVKRQEGQQAADDVALLDKVAEAAKASKVAQRDPSAFARFLELQTDGSPVENVYIPADQVVEFFQSNDMDYRGDDSPFSFDTGFADQLDEAFASGGDVVVRTSDFAAHVAGTPAWDALKEHIRLSPGGMSLAEAQTYAEASDAAMEQMGEDYAAQVEAQREDAAPRERLYQSIRDRLTNAGFTQSAADTNAALVTARYVTRASRQGIALVGDEFDNVEVNQVLPERLAPIVAADQLDIVIDAMKRARGQRSDRQKFGPSLAEWISAQGGIEDKGGDLASMGAASWHKGKVGRRKLIRPHDPGDPSFLPSAQQNANTPDELALRAQEAGYFPAGDRPTVSDLLDAIDGELRGKPLYAEDRSGATDQVREAADELAALLDQEGLDPATASKGDIRQAVQRYQSERTEGRAYDQAAIAAATPERMASTIEEAREEASAFLGQEIRNLSTGLGATVSKTTLRKMTSQSAVGKSTSAADHAVAVANVDKLFAHALLDERRGDHRGEPTIAAISRYVAPMITPDGRVVAVKMTVKETTGPGEPNPLYTLETIDVEEVKPGSVSETRAPGQNRDAPPPGFSPNIVAMFDRIKESRSLDQSFMDGPRGRITFATSGRSVVELFEARDPSTFLHEMGHLWLEELRADAEADGATDQTKADWEAVQGWFTANGHKLTGGTIPVDAHELWARGIERFLMEGKSPSAGLRKIFDTFRSWLVSIYQVVANLRSPITPEIRDVMDRLIATDAEIADARAEQGIKALFTDAASAGMTEPVFAEYQKLVGEARDEAFDALLYRTMSKIRRERTKAWRDERDAVRGEIEARVNARPEFRALALMRAKGSPVRLDRAWLVETYGEDALTLLPKAVPPLYADTRTTSADELAEMAGFATGDDLVRTLMSIGARTAEMRAADDKRSVRAALIEDETAAIMRDRHGDPLSDGSIEEEALAAIHNEKQGEVIASELRELGRRSNRRPTPYSLARQWAAETIARSKVAESLSGAAMQRYARAARNAAKAAETAMLAGDIGETFVQKQRQMLNNALIAEATKAKAAIDAAAARLAKVAHRATMKSIDQDYLDQAHALLEQVDFRTRSQKSIDRQESFEAWATQRQAEGFDVVVPPSFAATLGKENWSRLSVEKLLGLRDAVDQILHLGRLKQSLLDGKEKRDREAVIADAVAGMGGLKQRPPSDLMEPSRWDAIKSRVASIDGALLKMETVFDWLDGGNSNGVFNRVVFRRISEAQDRQADMMTDYLGRLNGLLKAIPKEQLARWTEKVAAPELLNRDTGLPWRLTRDHLVAVALNMGNAGNRQRLVDGYGWTEAGVMAALDRELTAADWAYVQGVWDAIDGLWPEIAALEKRLNGIEPDKVEATPVETRHGTFRGGYYPAVYDPSKSYAAEIAEARNSDGLFETIYTKATTTASSTKARADKVKRPIHLSLGIINRHVAEVIHDITHREAIIDADRFLADPRIMSAVDRTLGPEIRKQFRPWLQHIANELATDRAGNAGFEAFLKKMRTNATLVGMGFRASTALMQAAGYANSAEVIGERYMALGIARAARNPIEAARFVMERSGEVRNRMESLDRDIRDTIRREAGGWAALSNARRFAFHHIGYMDRAVVVPTWIGAYNKAIDAGMTEADAVYAADKAVRQSQGAGSAKDLAAVQRGKGKAGEALKLLTQFYSFMSAQYQRQRTLGRDVMGADASRPRNLPRLLSRAFWMVMAAPILSELLAGRGPDDDEDKGLWALQKMIAQALGPIPIVRDVVGALTSGFGYKFTPAARGVETLISSFKDAGRLLDGEETKRATRNVLETVGYFTGLIPGQVAAATQFVVDVAQGDQDPETVRDWIDGLNDGKLDEE